MAWRLASSLEQLRREVYLRWPGTTVWTIGDADHRNRASDHNPNGDGVVTAIDVLGDVQADTLWAKLLADRDGRIKYLIHDSQIVNRTVSPWQVRPYTGSNPHSKHIHISVSSRADLYDDPRPWGLTEEGSPMVLREGDRSQTVIDWQRDLLAWRHDVLPLFGADGDFGGETAKATERFQTEAGLTVDGIVGPDTFAAMEDILSAAPTPASDAKLAVLLRKAPLTIKPGKWTHIPMDTFYGGDESLFHDGYITGAPGYWLWATYLRFASQAEGQAMVRFVRDIGGDHDFTGTVDWNFTPGKDYKAHVWPFDPADGKPTGVEVWSSEPVELEYAQLKGVRLQ